MPIEYKETRVNFTRDLNKNRPHSEAILHPDAKVEQQQTFVLTEVEDAAELKDVLRRFIKDEHLVQETAKQIINRGLALAQQVAMRRFMYDEASPFSKDDINALSIL